MFFLYMYITAITRVMVITCMPLVNTNYFFLLLTLHLFFQDVVVNRRIRVKLLEVAEMVFKNMKCHMERE